VTHLRRRDLQRPRAGHRARRIRIQAQLELALPAGQPLPRRRLQRLPLLIVVRRAQMLDPPGSASRAVHDLHRPRARGGVSGQSKLGGELRDCGLT
jgi:hypothetical protein